MSEENVTRFLECQEAFNRLFAGSPNPQQALNDCLRFMDPGIRFEPQQASLQGTYVGHDGVIRWLVDLAEHYLAGGRIDFVDIRDLEDRVLGLGTLRFKAQGSGIETDVPVAMLATFRDGLMIEFQDFGDHASGLEAAGLSE